FKPVSDTLDNAYTYAGFSAVAQPCWTYSGTWNQYGATYGVGGQAHQSPNGSGTATGLFSGTGVDLIGLRQPGGGPYTVTIDGVPYDQYGIAYGAGGNASAYASGAASPVVYFSVRNLAPGQHTIVIAPQAGLLWLHGLVAYNGVGRGILPYAMSYSGKSAYQTLLNTKVDSARASVEAWALPPKLVVVEHIVNDMQQGVAFDTYEALLRRLCDSARVVGASVLFVIPFIGPMAGAWANLATAHAYIDRVYNVARRHNAAVLDINAAWEALGPTVAATYIGSGDAHPIDAGHADIAARLIGLLA
ncbi:MAG: SGNH/GDSL hydrolase family protein, partial [Chloroflexi bacterium]|nr:SGNH/GDSL hydrolase family protein [Chloroflexota bacterium]